ncbi:MAG: hypothetical protein HKN43_08075 [Rhodothermales bacterium]|nr:hypothetical protein [Rhodothermales bacterium]
MIFNKLPDSANVWIYTASRSLSADEQVQISETLNTFLEDWQSHGRRVSGQIEFLDGRFLLIGAHIPDGDISGCGIDASSRAANVALDLENLTWLDNLQISFRNTAGDVNVVSRPMFREYVEKGQISEDTIVFDLSVTTVAGIRDGRFERSFKDSWHAGYFLPSAVNK